jgi:hypothetical protein
LYVKRHLNWPQGRVFKVSPLTILNPHPSQLYFTHLKWVAQKLAQNKLTRTRPIPIPHPQELQGMCHTVPLPFTFKRILMQKKNYGNSNISPSKNNIIFQKSFNIS